MRPDFAECLPAARGEIVVEFAFVPLEVPRHRRGDVRRGVSHLDEGERLAGVGRDRGKMDLVRFPRRFQRTGARQFFVRGERREDFVKVFRTLKPEVVIGYSIYVYRISLAIAELRRRAESNPATAENYADLGSLLDNQARREEAEQFYRRAVAVDGSSTNGNYHLGIILTKRGQLSEAITHFHQAAQASPKDPDIRYDLAVVLALNGELNEAVEQFWATLKIHPNYTKAHYNLGVTLAKLGDTAGAIEQLRATLNIDTMYSKAYYQLGVLLAQQGEVAEAISQLRRALQIHAEYVEAHDSLGRLLAAQGQREEAVKHLETAVRILRARQAAPTAP